MLPKKVYSHHVLELAITAAIVTLLVAIQEKSWLDTVDVSAPISNVQIEQIQDP